jgi:hypothetical protein
LLTVSFVAERFRPLGVDLPGGIFKERGFLGLPCLAAIG